MKNEFIPYEQALELKELGFNEPCFGEFYSFKKSTSNDIFLLDLFISGIDVINKSEKLNMASKFELKAPLYQQAFRWFREEYVLDSIVQPTYSTKYQYRVFKVEAKSKVQVYGDYMSKEFNTYEEAELACLKKLIEIVKSNNDTP